MGATQKRTGLKLAALVSILAHLVRWALLFVVRQSARASGVSILAHLVRWALRAHARFGRLGSRSFNPRPPRKVGATLLKIRKDLGGFGFNPRPPRKVGATRNANRQKRIQRRFNPRPPRKVGATYYSQWNHERFLVSILAHLVRWALREPSSSIRE